jgi:hypothetical protein
LVETRPDNWQYRMKHDQREFRNLPSVFLPVFFLESRNAVMTRVSSYNLYA